MTTSTFIRTTLEREYKIADAPDLQDSTSTQRRIIRPRMLTLHMVPDTNLVYGATIEGQQVRRDGELAGSKLINAGIGTNSRGFSATPPPWLDKILEDDGLEWTVHPRR
jgi:hypothetical protein